MKLKAFFGAVCVILLILGCAQQSTAQMAPGTYADANLPSGAPDPQKEDSIWQVDPITGALNVKIPFTTTPVGGRGPRIPFSLLYNSSSTISLQSTFMFHDGINNTQIYSWLSGSYAVPYGPVGPWTTSGPFLYNSYSIIPDQIYWVYPPNSDPIQINAGYGCTVWGPFLYADEDGAVHDMNIEIASYNNGPINNLSYACNNIYSITTQGNFGQGRATDGSSLFLSGSSLPNGGRVQYPDGTLFSPGTDLYLNQNGIGASYPLLNLEDTNGNISSLAQDSEGRAPYTTNIPIGLPGQIPVGTYSVTTKGAYGAPETYSVTFQSISIGSFTMPHPTDAEITVEPGCQNPYTCETGYAVYKPVAGASFPAVTSIGLPNGTSYTFSYDPVYGSINKITFPTGGYVRFVYGIRPTEVWYGDFFQVSTITVTDVYVSDPITGEDHWSYSYSPNGASQNSSGILTIKSSVAAPDGTTTYYTGTSMIYSYFFGYGSRPSWKPVLEQITNSSGALVKSIATSYIYGGQGLPTQIATTLYDGPSPLQSQTAFVYDQWNNVVEKDESDFYSCSGAPCAALPASSAPWKRRTFTTYQYQNNPAWVTAHIVNKPSQVLVTDGAGHPYSLVQYGYDQKAVTGLAGYVNHDDTNYGPTSTLPRGNLTSESHCTSLNPLVTFTSASASTGAASVCNGMWLTTTHTYDLTGQVTSTTEPKGPAYTTTFSYTDNYVSGTPPGPTNGYLTKVIHPYGYADTYSYNYSSGQMATHTDWNSQITQYYYNDTGEMNRLTETKYPDNGDVHISYYDTAPPSITVTTKTGTASPSIVRTAQYDELGRVAQTQLTSDPGGTDFVNTTYDSMGRVQGVTNPFRTTSDPTYGITSYLYDALSRKRYQTQPDNSSISWTYGGNCVVFQDENKNQWQRCSNGLGQLTSVVEPSGVAQAPSMATNYGYDPSNNLLSVAQLGDSSETGITRNRTFTYDTLSRLLTSFNPETGLVSYSYDPNSNVQTKTDARGVITTYQYDYLNRLYSKTYSSNANGSLSSCYQYDSSSVCNGIGRLTNQWTQSSSAGSCLAPTGGFLTKRSILCYDQMGRILNEQQYTPASQAASTSYPLTYTYDLAGNLLTSTSGFGPTGPPITFTNTYDGANRLEKSTSSWTNNSVFPATLFSSPTAMVSTPCPSSFTTQYTPFGGLANASFGNGLTLNRAYNNRLRTTCENDIGTGTTPATSGSVTVTITGQEQTK